MSSNSTNLEEGIAAFDNMNYLDAYRLLMPLAEDGVAEAQCIIGSMYQTGIGASMDGTKAVEWYLKAADQKHPLACHNLGTIFSLGMPGVPRNLEKAEYFYSRAVELGFDMGINSAR